MKVVLLERVENLGAIGDVVSVKDGFARNFLLPREKALRATSKNLEKFELDRAAIEARNDRNKGEAQKVADKIDGQSYVMIRQAGETGQLYGSVNGRDVADVVDLQCGKGPQPRPGGRSHDAGGVGDLREDGAGGVSRVRGCLVGVRG